MTIYKIKRKTWNENIHINIYNTLNKRNISIPVWSLNMHLHIYISLENDVAVHTTTTVSRWWTLAVGKWDKDSHSGGSEWNVLIKLQQSTRPPCACWSPHSRHTHGGWSHSLKNYQNQREQWLYHETSPDCAGHRQTGNSQTPAPSGAPAGKQEVPVILTPHIPLPR